MGLDPNPWSRGLHSQETGGKVQWEARYHPATRSQVLSQGSQWAPVLPDYWNHKCCRSLILNAVQRSHFSFRKEKHLGWQFIVWDLRRQRWEISAKNFENTSGGLAVMPMWPFLEKEEDIFKALLFKLFKYSNRKYWNNREVVCKPISQLYGSLSRNAQHFWSSCLLMSKRK